MTIRQFSALKSLRHDPLRVPSRPDSTILSDSIPLFFIGRNRNGFWVACEASGRSGGIFLLKSSALRFGRKKTACLGVATMLVGDPLELATANGGGRLAAALSAALDIASRRAPAALAFVSMAVREWRLLVAQTLRALAGERRNRAAIEQELFRGQYKLSSKSDDDLPIVQ